jgi:hypothetical protein
MQKALMIRLSLCTLLSFLSGCLCHRQKPMEPQEDIQESRVSGPLSDPDIVWTEDDFK